MNFNKLAKESHANAVKHANLEAYNEPLLGGCAPFTSFIKDTLEDEMADVAIRLGEWPERWAWILTK